MAHLYLVRELVREEERSLALTDLHWWPRLTSHGVNLIQISFLMDQSQASSTTKGRLHECHSMDRPQGNTIHPLSTNLSWSRLNENRISRVILSIHRVCDRSRITLTQRWALIGLHLRHWEGTLGCFKAHDGSARFHSSHHCNNIATRVTDGKTAVASCWAQQLRAWATAIAWEFPRELCLAPTSWTGTWGGWWHPVAWPLLGGAGRMGGGWRRGICTGSRCPWAVLGWMGTCPVPWPSFSVLRFAPICWSGCTTNVWAVMLDLFATVPIG